MATHRIVCVDHGDVPRHTHIISVGISKDGKKLQASRRVTVADVRTALRAGERYYTVGLTSGKTADVEPYDCACGYLTLRSTADVVKDNNLDDAIRECSWKQR